MSAPIFYGVMAMLPENTRHRDKFAFLEELASIGITSGFYEQVVNYHDPGASPVSYKVSFDADKHSIDQHFHENQHAFSENWRRGFMPISYDHWKVLDNIDVFVPGSTGKLRFMIHSPQLGQHYYEIESTSGGGACFWEKLGIYSTWHTNIILLSG